MDQVLVRVKQLLARALGDETMAEHIGDDDDIIQGLGLDSVQLIGFLLTVEDEYDLELDFDRLEIDGLYSVRAFCEFVLSHGPVHT
ncbi:acyl carrier protein [Sphaerisporangium aureirubrum]|uniref:Acyl carrier protein n=1 Tax=Sphaerisporangium aureirubrum TaxID=1544736 RepID=A0ABW1NAJ1_9ACTN